MTYKNINLQVDEAICRLTFNRPDRRNSLSEELMCEVLDAIEKINRDSSIRVVVLSGAGQNFCAGFDMRYFEHDTRPEEVREVVAMGPKFKNAITNLRPITIASIAGNCVGGGVVVALACDFRFASLDSNFWLPETQWGIPLAFGSLPMLNEGMTKPKAMEFILLGRKLTAKELFGANLLNGVGTIAERDSLVSKACEEIVAIPAPVADITKRQVLAAREAWTRSPYEFSDAALLYNALTDKQCQDARARLMQRIKR